MFICSFVNAGQSETVNMLLTRSRSISIDAKNHLGFTPLMKAALQGRTRCAKLLLFAGDYYTYYNSPKHAAGIAVNGVIGSVIGTYACMYMFCVCVSLEN